MVSESLKGTTARAIDELAVQGNDSTSSVDLAFKLWAQTLISKEGYNSALVVYDPFGKELSRFSVGLTSFEQMELLTELFHKEEEGLLVVDKKAAGGSVKYYGEWGYVVLDRSTTGWIDRDPDVRKPAFALPGRGTRATPDGFP